MTTRSFIRCAVSLSLALVLLAGIVSVFDQGLSAQSRVDANAAGQSSPGSDHTVGGPCGATIQACIDNPSVVAGDRILIPAGRYTESLTLNKAVSLIGADAGTTIVHAVIDDRAMLITGSAITATTIISGLTFAGGNLTGFTCPAGCGGGILVTGAAQPLIQNSVISNNRTDFHGGGLYVAANSPLTLTNVAVLSNTADFGNGGGMFTLGPLTLEGGQFENNDGSQGGGLYVSNTLSMSGTVFINNTTFGKGGGAHVAGAATVTGGRFEDNRSTSPSPGASFGGGLVAAGALTLSATEFISNSAQQGGGMYVSGSAALTGARFERNTAKYVGGGLGADNPLTLNDTEFISNASEFGGGGVRANGPIALIGGIFRNNQVGVTFGLGLGGGLEAYDTLAISGTKFISNTAPGRGGGVFHSSIFEGPIGDGRIVNALLARNTTTANGAGLFLGSGGNIVILHTTIADVSLNPSQAIAVVSGTVGITNSIIASHTVGISQTNGSVYQDYNLFFGNGMTQTGTIAGGSHSLNGNPAFTNSATDDYHVSLGSAAIDMGTDAGVTTDIDGDIRPVGGGFDIGADEFQLQLDYHIYLPLVLRNF